MNKKCHWWPSLRKTSSNYLHPVRRLPKYSHNNLRCHIQSQDSAGPLTADAFPKLIKHGVVCYLFINLLFDASQRALWVVVKIIEGIASEQSCSFLHAIPIRPIWPCENAPFCSLEGAGWAASRKTFHSLFNINHSYWEMLPHVHKTPQPFLWWATLCYLHVYACASPVWLSTWVFLDMIFNMGC